MKKEENKENEEKDEKEEDIVNPWVVQGKIKYDKLVEEFGTEVITEELIQRFEKVTKKQVHPWIKRGLFFLS